MGNKQGKPRGSSSASKRDDASQPRAQQQQSVTSTLPPPAPSHQGHRSSGQGVPSGGKPPTRPPAASSLLEFKLSQLDVSTIFAPQEIQAIRRHLAGLLGQSESDPVVIPKDEFFRFLGATSSSLYTSRLYTIFDLSGKGYVRTQCVSVCEIRKGRLRMLMVVWCDGCSR